MKTRSEKQTELPDGIYSGKWSGYTVTVIHEGRVYEFHTVEGVRSLHADCSVVVECGVATVEDI